MSSERGRFGVGGHSAALAALSCIFLVSPARAGHAPLVPEPKTILLREAAPEEVVVGTRRGGYFMTRDGGETWAWICEAGVGYDDEEVYPGVFLQSGTLVVSTGFGGLSVSSDGCGWSAWLPSEQPFVADVRAVPGEAEAVVALESHADGAGFVNQLWQSSDDAQTWQALGGAFAPDTQAVSFAISNTGELYVATSGPGGAELQRSDDSAASWTRSAITPEAGVTPRVIGAHEASGVPHLYVVLDYLQAEGITTFGDRVLMSLDRGASFVSILQGVGDLSAWSLAADGQRLAVGGASDGIHVLLDASTASGDSPMAQVWSSATHALAWDAAGQLYAAGHENIDGFSLGVSRDEGRSFAPLFALCQVQGPLACPSDTTVGTSCLSDGETGWDVRKEVADANACREGELATGGAGPSSPVPGGSPTLGRAGAAAPLEDVATTGAASSERAASCAVAPPRNTPAAWLLLALALVGRRTRRWGRTPATDSFRRCQE